MSDDGIYEVVSRGRTRYRFRVDIGHGPDGKRLQKMVTRDSYDEADRERKRILSEVADGKHVRRDRAVTVGAFLEQWLRAKESTSAAGTIDVYRRNLRHLVKVHGHRALYDLTHHHVAEVRDAMLSGRSREAGEGPLSAATVNLMLTALSAALDSAVITNQVRYNAASAKLVGRAKDRGKARRIKAARGSWKRADGTTFAASVSGHRMQAALLLSLLGLRRGEVLALDWDRDVDLDGSQDWALQPGQPCIRVTESRVKERGRVVNGPTKTEASERTLPLPPVAVTALKRWQRQQAAERLASKPGEWADTGHVFTDANGNGLHPDWYSDLWHRLVRDAGLPDIPVHGARHWCASRLAETVAYGVAKAWLGHSKQGTTEGYQHVEAGPMIAAALAFEEILTGGGQSAAPALGVV